MFVDTHCHLNMLVKKEFDVLLTHDQIEAIDAIVQEAYAAGVEKIINVGTSLPESINSVAIAKRYPTIFATVGIHPCDATESWYHDFKEIETLVKNKEENKIVGVGEVGLDFYHKPFFRQRQEDAFKAHIELAIEHQLPLSIHVRDAGDELLEVLEPYVKNITGAVIHCFSQNQQFATTVLEWGLYVGIDAPITYPKNELLRDIVRNIPLSHIILETDAPFLPPQEYRGKQNRPAYIPLFAQTVADLKKVTLAVVQDVTTANVKKLFRI